MIENSIATEGDRVGSQMSFNLPGRGGKRMARKPRKMSVEHIVVLLVILCNLSLKECQKSKNSGRDSKSDNVDDKIGSWKRRC